MPISDLPGTDGRMETVYESRDLTSRRAAVAAGYPISDNNATLTVEPTWQLLPLTFHLPL